MSRRKKIIIGAIAAVVVLGVIASITPPAEEPEPAAPVAATPEPPTASPTATPTAALPSPPPTPEPAATPTPTAPPTATPEPTRTPSPEEALRAFVFCERLRVTTGMLWGQAPGLAYAGDPRTSGSLEEGDYIRVLTPEPNDDGEIRVQVFPHDGRAVGNSDDRVWISWAQLLPYRLDLIAFVCED